MKKLAFLISLLISQSANALWTNVEDADKSEMTYVDLDTMKREGDIVTVWTYVDFEKPQKNKLLSASSKTQYDCKNEMSKILYVGLYHTNKLKGKPYARGAIKDYWEVVAPYTMGGKTMRMVCGGKNTTSNEVAETLNEKI